MALYLLGKTVFNSSEEIGFNDRSIYEYYEQISQILRTNCPKICLAEPTVTVSKDPKQSFISWYIDTKTEPQLPSEAEQDYINQQISEAVSSLSQAYSQDSKESKLLKAALHLQDKQDILIADDKIILKNWGIQSLANTQGSGLSLFPLTPLQGKNADTESTSSLNDVPDDSIVPKEAASDIKHNLNNSKKFVGLKGGLPLFITRLVAAILFFIIGFLLGWRILYAEHPTKIAKVPVIEAQELVRKKPEIEQKNKALEDEIKKLEEQLKTPLCDLDKSRAAPELNKSLDHSSAPMKSNGQNFQGSLPELLEKSTVFILVKGQDEDGDQTISSGSGFFITPDLIVTNRHVVENAENNTVLVTNKALGQLKAAHIVSTSDHSEDVNSFDLAVLKIEDAPPQQPLIFSLEAQPLQTVVAAGYPGIIIRQDGALKKLAQGDVNAIPGVVLTKGEVNAIQENAKGEKVIPHSAMVSPGNSGGELVDLCGRVVGVNTFVTMDSKTSSHSNYAQKSDSIIRALQAANIPIQLQSGACKDGVVSRNSNSEKQPETPNKQDKQENTPSTPSKAEPSKPKEGVKPSTTPENKSDKPSTPHGDKP
ncbi:Periplasmic serine protease [Commensalibacter communis]|uniref:trypsin-like peptidase domain-containing protein n=1 Tax=Commensalibacter communis TaxID=2972786 RepID=UPI0022FF570D|nr:trypsin-like peptidase domain-containing protein [Commensalibacter communis]CAI3922196.1 Periplasmic serine protease [Commensalibacter communis]CAI3937682.1 Periplasmic serine protease [Commensalibacter communis]